MNDHVIRLFNEEQPSLKRGLLRSIPAFAEMNLTSCKSVITNAPWADISIGGPDHEDGIQTILQSNPVYALNFLHQAILNNTGCTVFAMGCDKHCPPVRALVEELNDFFYPRTFVSAVSISSYGGGFHLHADKADVLVLQSTGSRTWTITEPLQPNSDFSRNVLKGQVRMIDKAEAVPDEGMQFELHENDALFVPGLFPHSGKTVGVEKNETLSISYSLISELLTPETLLKRHGLNDQYIFPDGESQTRYGRIPSAQYLHLPREKRIMHLIGMLTDQNIITPVNRFSGTLTSKIKGVS